MSVTRHEVPLTAFRRNSDSRAARLRAELPVLLGRLVAEVPGAALELRVGTGPDGLVDAAVAVTSRGGRALAQEVAAVLTPAAEVGPITDVTGSDRWTDEGARWPLIGAAQRVVGFRAEGAEHAPAAAWCTAGATGVTDLVGLVNSHVDNGISIRMTAADGASLDRPAWNVELALLVGTGSPALRVRAAVRARFPGLEVAALPGGSPVALRVSADELAAAFAVPVAGEEPLAGTCVGTAAPLPLHPTRRAVAGVGALRIGSAVTVSGMRHPVLLGLDERMRHVHVLGRTGTGKSSFLAGLVHEVARCGDGALVLDPHGRLVDRIVAELPDAALARTLVVRCGDVANPVPLNPLAVDDPVRREIAIDDVNAAFQYLFDPKYAGMVGPRFRERVAMGLRALAAVHGPRASLLDVPAALSDHRFLKHAAARSNDDRLRAWVKNDTANSRSSEYADLVSWVNSKFEGFASTTAMRAILASGANALDLGAVMDGRRLVLVDLSKGELGESATRLLGYLYLNAAWIGALQRRHPERPFTVVVDEAQSMISGSLSAMLSEGRKFGLAVVLAHQYLGQLDAELLPAIDGNVATTVAFRGSGADAPTLRQRFGDRVDTATLMTLPDLSAITLRTAADVSGEPYTLTVDHNETVRARTGGELAEFASTLAERSAAELVDPHRSATKAAAEGRSNVAIPESDDIEGDRDAGDAGDAKDAKDAAPAPPRAPRPRRPHDDEGSFLDEWMAKRRKLTSVTTTPATTAPATD